MRQRQAGVVEAFVRLWDWGHFRPVDGTEAHPDNAFVGLGLTTQNSGASLANRSDSGSRRGISPLPWLLPRRGSIVRRVVAPPGVDAAHIGGDPLVEVQRVAVPEIDGDGVGHVAEEG